MLVSLALIFLLGMGLGAVFEKLRLPKLIGMLIAGIVLGPHMLNWIDPSILLVSADLRKIALIIILLRAGLSLNMHDLKKVGRPALLMCFVPACAEIAGMLLFAPPILGITVLDAAILGSVVAAVSPAVVVPKMLKLMEKGYGTEKGIPQLVMAGASVDDVFVIVLFTSFTSLAQGGEAPALRFVEIPVSIVLGVAAGLFIGKLLCTFFEKVHIRDTAKTMVLLSIAFLLVGAESRLAQIVPFSGLLAVMAVGVAMLRVSPHRAKRLATKLSKWWVAAEVLLFALVGATMNMQYALAAGGKVVALLIVVLLFRVAGVFVCMLGTTLTMKERLFCAVAYIPKATVQAAIGGVPLAMDLLCGELVLTVAVLAILVTAPLGAFGIDVLHKECLNKEEPLLRKSAK